MDPLTTAYYELRFENQFLRAKGVTFQTLFATLMGNAHPADFIPCRPWGATGDRKNDGYLRSPLLGDRISGTSVSINSVVQAFLDGRRPEEIQSEHPTLRLSQVYAVIAFYLD